VRADRLVSLVLLLQARGPATARDLARELGVSVRTIYRDLAGLSAAGVPVLAEPGPGGGCRLLDGYRFPLRSLRPEEAEALLILGVPGVLSELGMDGALTAAHRQIRVTAGLDGHGRRDGPEPAPALVHLDMPGWFRSREQVPHLRTLAEALRERRQLKLRYQREADDEPVPRIVSPLGLVNKAGVWYLVALPSGSPDHRQGQVRVFRAGRIASARIMDTLGSRPDSFDLAAFWDVWSREFTASRPQLPVRLRASPLALEVFPEVFGDQVLEALGAALPPDEEGWPEVTLSFEHELAAAQRLAGFGGEVEVLSPLAVRERLVAAARGILGRYQACSEYAAAGDNRAAQMAVRAGQTGLPQHNGAGQTSFYYSAPPAQTL
jgi:predicted DNA-binding transcriptional regulator YafY